MKRNYKLDQETISYVFSIFDECNCFAGLLMVKKRNADNVYEFNIRDRDCLEVNEHRRFSGSF